MNRRQAITAATVASGFAFAEVLAAAAPAPRAGEDACVAWVRRCLKDIQSIKPGQTRADVLEKFDQSGGLYRRQLTTYMYKKCPFFKISITFEPADAGDKLSPKDRIVKVATPFLEDPLAE